MPINNQTQLILLNQLKTYLNIKAQSDNSTYHPNDILILMNSLSRGYCSGIVALWLYYKYKNKKKYFYNSIINPILEWDGQIESLSIELESLIENTLSCIVWLQGASAPFKQASTGMISYSKKKQETPSIQQSDYDVLINIIKQNHDVSLKKEYEITFVFTNNELQDILKNIPPHKNIRLASTSHAIGLEYIKKTKQYILFDPNGFFNLETKKYLFEKKCSIENVVSTIQSAFLYPADSKLTGLTISIFDNSQKRTPYYLNRVETIQKLFNARMQNAQTIHIDEGSPYDNANPLWLCAKTGHIDTIKWLLEHGAKVNIPNKNGIPPIYVAAENGYENIIKLLLDSTDPLTQQMLINQSVKNYGLSALYFAAFANQIKVVKLLLDLGAKANSIIKIESGACSSPFHVAATHGYLSIVKLLFNAKGGKQLIHTQTQDMASPLYLAAQNGQIKMVQWLLRQGAHLDNSKKQDMLTNDFLSPIHIAARNNHLVLLKLLLQSKKRSLYLNRLTEKGLSPLYFAARYGHIEMVEWLLEQGGIIDKTALQMTAHNGHTAILKLLFKFEITRHFIDLPMEGFGYTPLALAVDSGHLEIVEFLLDQGATIDKCAIHAASETGHQTILMLLLNSEVGQNLINTPHHMDGPTPLYLATMNGHLECVKLLLNRGAKIDINTPGVNPLLAASHYNHGTIFQLLESTLKKVPFIEPLGTIQMKRKQSHSLTLRPRKFSKHPV